MTAVYGYFGKLAWDLAADETNTQCQYWYNEQQDSLKQEWHKLKGMLWLNPPYANIRPWVLKCLTEKRLGASILLLVPASVGSEWFASYVHREATVLFLSPRLSFDGKNPYPKDLMLCHFNPDFDRNDHSTHYGCWRWDQ
jgi:site-specific DNA-methyltransferase (adenine-specific)